MVKPGGCVLFMRAVKFNQTVVLYDKSRVLFLCLFPPATDYFSVYLIMRLILRPNIYVAFV